jgi:hypothetical protein
MIVHCMVLPPRRNKDIIMNNMYGWVSILGLEYTSYRDLS